MTAELSLSVVIITYRRPVELATCLTHLSRQTRPAEEIVVVDASEGDESSLVVSRFSDIHYLRNPAGRGNMTSSRNRALCQVTGDIVAFLDDDAYPRVDYIDRLVAAYMSDPAMMLGCSRTLNDQLDEDKVGVDRIGRFTDRGEIWSHFAAQPGKHVIIDHGIGATMSFRRECLLDLGGFREWFRGISGICEDTDAFLRAQRLSYKAVFVHNAVATHVGAPQARGRRFDARYRIAASRNLAILLVANCGLIDRRVLDQVHAMITEISKAARTHRSRRLVGRTLSLLGFGIGLARGICYCRGWGPAQPRRADAQAAAIRKHLSDRPGILR